MKKRGFTLAEVLITLGIIGVVAALTAPQLVLSSKNEATCSKLASTVSNLENAFHNAIAQEQVSGLDETSIGTATTTNARAGALGKYMHFTSYEGTSIVTKNGTRIQFTLSNDKANNFYSGTANENTVRNAGGTLVDYLGYVDINTSPELQMSEATSGKNKFRFDIGNDGTLYPWGGSDHAIYKDKGYSATSSSRMTRTGTGTNSCNKSHRETLYCTARIVEDGYKMNY